jgi:hypothetical protein
VKAKRAEGLDTQIEEIERMAERAFPAGHFRPYARPERSK